MDRAPKETNLEYLAGSWHRIRAFALPVGAEFGHSKFKASEIEKADVVNARVKHFPDKGF